MARALRDRGPGGILSLLRLLDRYGAEIEFDLLTRGIDPLVLFHECRWRRLLSLIRLLPRTSLTREAMVQDDEMVAELLAKDPKAGAASRHPRFSEFGPTEEMLADVTDRLGEVVRGLVGLGGRKAKPVKPVPRPRTAFQRIQTALDQQQHESVVARLLPPEQRAATDAAWDTMMIDSAQRRVRRAS